MYYLYKAPIDKCNINSPNKWIVTMEQYNNGYYVHYYYTDKWCKYDYSNVLVSFKDSYIQKKYLKKSYKTLKQVLEDIPELMLL